MLPRPLPCPATQSTVSMAPVTTIRQPPPCSPSCPAALQRLPAAPASAQPRHRRHAPSRRVRADLVQAPTLPAPLDRSCRRRCAHALQASHLRREMPRCFVAPFCPSAATSPYGEGGRATAKRRFGLREKTRNGITPEAGWRCWESHPEPTKQARVNSSTSGISSAFPFASSSTGTESRLESAKGTLSSEGWMG